MTDLEHALIIVNPVSGPGNAKDRKGKISSAARVLGWKGVIVETTPEKNAGIIAAEAIKKGAKHIIACGGDGTIMDVLSVAVKKPITVGIVPLGTGNLFARNLEIPLRLEDAMQIALSGRVIRVDVGRANERYFGIIAGMGLDADMIKNADRKLKDKIGIFAYLFAVIQSLKKPRRNYRIVINNKDEKVYRAKSIIVANMGKITGGIQAVPDAHPQNGRLHVGVIKANSFVSWLSLLTNAIFKGNVNKSPAYSLLKGTQVDIYPLNGPKAYECDGEVFPAVAKLSVTIIPQALSLFVSRSQTDF